MALTAFDGCEAQLACTFTGRGRQIEADALVMVTARRPNDSLYYKLLKHLESGKKGAPKTLRRIGDCDAPAIIAAAVYAGHRYARELDSTEGDKAQVPHDRVFDETE